MTGSSPNTPAWIKKLIRYRQNVINASGATPRNYTTLRRTILAEIKDLRETDLDVQTAFTPAEERELLTKKINAKTETMKS